MHPSLPPPPPPPTQTPSPLLLHFLVVFPWVSGYCIFDFKILFPLPMTAVLDPGHIWSRHVRGHVISPVLFTRTSRYVKTYHLCSFRPTVASWLARSSPDRAVLVRALVGDIVFSSRARHFTLTVPLSTQVCKWAPVHVLLGVTLRWTSIPSRGK